MRVAPELVESMLEDLSRLVQVESPSGDTVAGAASARAVAQVIAERLGREPEHVVVDGVHHVVLRGMNAKVLLLAHHDTVWPIGTLAELPFRIHEGVITGPGTFDMKLGLVQAVHALRLVEGELGVGGVTLLVTGDEEVGSITSRRLIEAEATGCRAVLVFEAAGEGGALKTERKGTSMYRLLVEGRAAHAGLEPERGVNAATALAELVLALPAIAATERGTTVTPTTLSAGTTVNTVPASGALDIDVRVKTLAEQDRADREIRALTTTVPGAAITVLGGPNRPPLERRMTTGLFERARGLSRELGLDEPLEIAVGGASDGNFTGGIGVPTLDGLGAVGGGAHARNEHALVDWIAPRTELVAALIADVIRADDPTNG